MYDILPDDDDPILEKLLSDMLAYGSRYRIWKGKRSYTPAALLDTLHAQKSAPLRRRCDLQWEERTYAGKTILGQSITFVVETQHNRNLRSSPYFIEDLLNSYNVAAWLEGQPPHKVIAVLAPEAEYSTFIHTYFLDQIGAAPDELVMAKLPPWYSCLEALIRSLDSRKPRQDIQVNVATLSRWIGVIQYAFDLESLEVHFEV